MEDLPHRGDLALDFGPRIVNNRLKRNSHHPCHVIATEADKEADVEAATITPDDTARPLTIVLRCQATDCLLADGINEPCYPFIKLFSCGGETVWRVPTDLGIGSAFVLGADGFICLFVALACWVLSDSVNE